MKVANLVLTFGAALSLAACGSGNEKDTSPAAEASVDSVAPEADAQPSASAPEEAAAPAAPAAPAIPAAPAAEETEPVAEVASSGPPDSFLVCSACHAVEPGKNGIGPTLAGIHGAKAAAVPGFSYSEPLKKANITWTDAALDKWLQAPMKMVPGTRMVFGGIPDAAKRKELIAYMKSL